ncbi:MAG: hypothetical protein D6715_10480 [Calditrichaeota bacterium]|nr:MAG: hypothetical protein D6715_10480 [Calditrichota bacterium]
MGPVYDVNIFSMDRLGQRCKRSGLFKIRASRGETRREAQDKVNQIREIGQPRNFTRYRGFPGE